MLGHWPWLTLCISIVANLVFLGASWGPELEYEANFLHRHNSSASWHYPMSIRAIGSVSPQAILTMSVTLFTSGTLCAINISLIICNNALYCSQLNGEHAGKGFRSLRFIVFEIYAYKVEKIVDFSKIWPLTSDNWVTYWPGPEQTEPMALIDIG